MVPETGVRMKLHVPGLASRASAKVASVVEIILCLDRSHLYSKSDLQGFGLLWKVLASLALAKICSPGWLEPG